MKKSKRWLETEYLAYDATPISSYSNTLKQVKYGLNKEHDLLPQPNLVLVFDEKSKLPVYYRKLPGNITDVKTIQNLLKDIDFLQMDKVQLVMDRGFYSETNVKKNARTLGWKTILPRRNYRKTKIPIPLFVSCHSDLDIK